MDDFSIIDKRIERALNELNIINKFLGGRSTSVKGIKKLLEISRKKEITILDIGSGSSENIDQNEFPGFKIKVNGVDLNFGVCNFQKINKPSNNVICANAFSLPIKSSSVDIVHVSLFLHHFNEEEIAILLKEFLKISKIGIVINDLERSIFALAGIKILTKIFSKSEMVKNDAPLSVKKGFTKNELKKLVQNSGNGNSEIIKRWAFRLLCIIKK